MFLKLTWHTFFHKRKTTFLFAYPIRCSERTSVQRNNLQRYRKRYGFYLHLAFSLKMSKNGPIIIVDDDPDDQHFLLEVGKRLNVRNKFKVFLNNSDVLSYLRTTKDHPFVIFSDVNMPQQGGFALRQEILADKRLREKSIPFIFFSTSSRDKDVERAYQLTVQGYFVKPYSLEEVEKIMKTILDYWTLCKHPYSE
jgi:CheY-like chemotaxis protein